MPPRDAIADAINAYFQYCHLQPLWLFDRNDLSSVEECREETIFSLLALSLCHSNHSFFKGRSEELSQKYAQLAREHIMLRIAQGKVTLSTIQSLCMLTLANFQANDVHLVSLHVNIAMTFAKCAGLDLESHHDEVSLQAEARRRVFWSLHLLHQMYGQHGSVLNIIQDIESPQYVTSHPDFRKKSNLLPPSMPLELVQGGGTQKNGIWAYMVQLSTLWREVRMYVMQCDHTNSEPPWSVESGYAVIGAHLMDLETKLPTYHRYDFARFSDREKEELQQNRGYWSPWLYLQFAYHTIHSTLNHPFLYSSRPQQSAQLAVPNTFWKTSSELAFIHATWIVRLIDMVSEKAYRISDPFIGHCVAIAATVHIYFCRAADRRIREAAQVKMATCVTFLGELALLWPSCRRVLEKLQTLIHSAFPFNRSDREEEISRGTISINTRLMWEILQYDFAGKDSHLPGHGLFHESLYQDNDDSDHEEHTVETQIFHNPTTEVDMSTGGQALPPYSGHPANQSSQNARGRGRQDEQLPYSIARTVPMLYASVPEAAAAPWATPGNSSTKGAAYDPFFQFQDAGSPFYGFWEVGNL
ncbi:uncharacterized protein Z518_03241 [Rhinocladiella mackenziei CBS 650.93]|uniref:Xylanolytic transcriptional activator regulatory domain-containing protein n=1 Tax=Rhinocladiella mackenziei CBS 650.93 TaxID=1442369 RepID=A0A0D2JGX5_9EURO|nr:uncharacterized protein Z518_03241 [Rhinocladiella mackenziei CBS 650.93]KIX08585.1 hypothetical protein Z518_03241 [Rhinocladiella mackenziei CBS 650.93]